MRIPPAPPPSRGDCACGPAVGEALSQGVGRVTEGQPSLSPAAPTPSPARHTQQQPLWNSRGPSRAGVLNSFLKGRRADILGIRATRWNPALVTQKQPQTFSLMSLCASKALVTESGGGLHLALRVQFSDLCFQAFLLSAVSTTPGVGETPTSAPFATRPRRFLCVQRGEGGSRDPSSRPHGEDTCPR